MAVQIHLELGYNCNASRRHVSQSAGSWILNITMGNDDQAVSPVAIWFTLDEYQRKATRDAAHQEASPRGFELPVKAHI